MSMSVGDGSGSRSANSATAKTSSIQPAAAQNTGPSRRPRRAGAAAPLSSRLRSSVAMADPRIKNSVEHVDNKIHDDEARGDQQHHALHDDEIAGVDRADNQPADPRQRKNRLHDQGTADQTADIDAGDRDERERGRLQRMNEQDAPRRQALGPGKRDV